MTNYKLNSISKFVFHKETRISNSWEVCLVQSSISTGPDNPMWQHPSHHACPLCFFVVLRHAWYVRHGINDVIQQSLSLCCVSGNRNATSTTNLQGQIKYLRAHGASVHLEASKAVVHPSASALQMLRPLVGLKTLPGFYFGSVETKVIHILVYVVHQAQYTVYSY